MHLVLYNFVQYISKSLKVGLLQSPTSQKCLGDFFFLIFFSSPTHATITAVIIE